MSLTAFICPHCQSPLVPDAKTWTCDGSLNDKHTQHPFDVARQGYVNLLPVQHKKSKDPGDSQASIDARHRFLHQGHYQPLRDKVSKIIGHNTQSDCSSPRYWLDVGCGEGYYTQAIATATDTLGRASLSALIALDISKPAVATLAKTAKQNHYLWFQDDRQDGQQPTSKPTPIYPIVASASKLPLAEGSISGISSIFSPILPSEFARVLKDGGRLIIAKPDVGHLQSMREALFDDVRTHDSDKFLQDLAPYFELTAIHRLACELSLDKQGLSDLLTMTPYSYRVKAEKRKALLAKVAGEGTLFEDVFKSEAKFVVYLLQKR